MSEDKLARDQILMTDEQEGAGARTKFDDA